MRAIAALIGIDLLTGEIVKQIFANTEEIKDPIFACEQSQIQCEDKFPELNFTIIANTDALELHKKIIKEKLPKFKNNTNVKFFPKD